MMLEIERPLAKIDLHIQAGRFFVKTLETTAELQEAFRLRFQVFQVEMLGSKNGEGEDQDEYDAFSDHLGIFDSKSRQIIGTCRLNCSLFTSKFYSEQEFQCSSLIQKPGIKLEIGRVCVSRVYRKGIIVMMLWRAIANYMMKTRSRYLFGCGSIATEDAQQAAILYRFLEEQSKVRTDLGVAPTEKYISSDFDRYLIEYQRPLQENERALAESLMPSLCRSYFDIGCFTPSTPAFDRDFKCIDFLTVLDLNELDPRMRRKMFGDS